MREIQHSTAYLDHEVLKNARYLVVIVDQHDQVSRLECPGIQWQVEGLLPGQNLPGPLQAIIDVCDDSMSPQLFPYVQLAADINADVHVLNREKGKQIILQDVSVGHESEHKFQQKAHEVSLLLEKQAELNRLLEEKRAEADLANQAKSRFIASMSHEFKSPISSIMAHAERLNVQQPGAPELAAIQRGSWYLLTLVENLLEQARMGEGGRSLELASVDVMALLRDMQELFSIQACSKGLTFSVSNPDEVQYVYADDLRLRQVLVNLLSNAVRYTLEGGIRLQCRRLGDAIEFCVSDTGKGIDKADIQRIFQPFTRVNPAGEGGAGLGLTISQQLVAAMHGELNVQSQPGKGSTFCFSLPAGTVALSETTESLQGLRVVLLEDDNDIREMYQIWLEDWGAVVRGFTSCERAIAEFNDYPTDLVLTDLFLEDGNGMDLLKILRETNPNVATVVCSGSDNIGASCEDEKELVDCFISKPVSASRLESAIQSVVRTRRNK